MMTMWKRRRAQRALENALWMHYSGWDNIALRHLIKVIDMVVDNEEDRSEQKKKSQHQHAATQEGGPKIGR